MGALVLVILRDMKSSSGRIAEAFKFLFVTKAQTKEEEGTSQASLSSA